MDKIEKIDYSKLNNKQKEAYNFQKVSSLFATYGFETIKLPNDWHGADFLAIHFFTGETLRVQLKGTWPGFYEKYYGRQIYICCLIGDTWYLYNHDDLLAQLNIDPNFSNGKKKSIPNLRKNVKFMQKLS